MKAVVHGRHSVDAAGNKVVTDYRRRFSLRTEGTKVFIMGQYRTASYKYRNFTIGLHDLQAVGAEEISAERPFVPYHDAIRFA